MNRIPASPMIAAELAAALPPAPTSILDRVFPLDQCAELPWIPAVPIYGEFSRQTAAIRDICARTPADAEQLASQLHALTDRSAFTPPRTRND